MSDPLGIHKFDQMQAGFRDMAAMLFTYYTTLVGAGFSVEQAWELARDMHTHLMMTSMPFRKPEED